MAEEQIIPLLLFESLSNTIFRTPCCSLLGDPKSLSSRTMIALQAWLIYRSPVDGGIISFRMPTCSAEV